MRNIFYLETMLRCQRVSRKNLIKNRLLKKKSFLKIQLFNQHDQDKKKKKKQTSLHQIASVALSGSV